MKNTAIFFAFATMAAASFPVAWAMAADTSNSQQQTNSTQPHANYTGLKSRNPATDAAGMNGLPGNKSGKSVQPDNSNGSGSGSGSGEQGSQNNQTGTQK